MIITKDISNIKSPAISVIIPFSGNNEDLFDCLNSLIKQDFNLPFEIIIVKSGANQEVEKIVDTQENVLLVTSSTLVFPGKARNLGVESSRSELLVFIDADCIAERRWLSEIYSSFKSGNEIILGPVVQMYPFHPVASVDNLFLFTDFLKNRSLKNFHHFAGCNLGITKEVFYKSGKFPEDMKIGEDTIFSQFALRQGKLYFNRKAIVKHSGRKKISEYKKHLEEFGYYRGYLSLKVSQIKFRRSYFFPILLGMKRILYILFRTLQWNPIGLLRIIFLSPLLIIGISAWIKGFRNGQKKNLSELASVEKTIPLGISPKEQL